MIREILQPKEKKVEYIELIYDLIFVYIIGRNNQLLHSFENGFVTLPAFLVYVMSTLAIIQIWNYSTYYINVYGRHSIREHVFMFVNMFLLYFIGEGTRTDWQAYHTQYHIAWALILVNIGAQYLIELRNHQDKAETRKHTVQMAVILFIEAAMVASDILIYQTFGNTWMSLAAILFGLGAVTIFGQKNSADVVDFSHLSERAMLYVVFTFGEMIIAISSYFEEGFSVNGVYFALMAFLIVVGLFLSYGMFYDHIIDREKKTNGLSYMLLHIFLVFALNNITNGLEFMREEEISLIPKILFLIGSMVLFFICLLRLGSRHAKAGCSRYHLLYLKTGALSAAFIVLMLLLRENMKINIFVTVAFVFALYLILYRYGKRVDSAESAKEQTE